MRVSRSSVIPLRITLGILLALASSGGVVLKAGGAERVVESVAAQVGNEIVLTSEVMELAGPIEERLRKAGAPPAEVASMRKEALERLIENRLLSSVVERLELTATREEIDSAISAIAEDNDLTIDQLLSSISSHGLSIEEYRSKIQGEIERTKVVNTMVRSRVQITDEEVQALYEEQFGGQHKDGEEIHIRHIVIMKDGPKANSMESACQIANEARDRIASGEIEFTAAARKISDMNPERGGDLGWMHREDIAGWMSDAISSLAPGEISSVVSMPFGCNLLQVVDRREFKFIEYEQAKPQLQNVVYQRKTQVEYEKWLDVLRSQTYIERKAGFGG